MALFSMRNAFCALLAVVSTGICGCKGAPVTSRAIPGLDTFRILPRVAPVPSIPAHTPLQFNGSVPGQGDTPEQLGWWPIPTSGATTNQPVELISFVQYNADEGIVFWAERTAFEIYLTPVEGAPGTWAVILGQPWSRPDSLSGSFTVDETDGGVYGFGWEGDYESWFVCGGPKGDGEYYGLYYGELLDAYECSSHFVLEALYE